MQKSHTVFAFIHKNTYNYVRDQNNKNNENSFDKRRSLIGHLHDIIQYKPCSYQNLS